MKGKGLVSDELQLHTVIDEGIPAIENYVLLNQSSRSYRKTVPLTSTEQPFVSFSERELALLFWQNDALKKRLQDLALEVFEDKSFIPSQMDLNQWLQGVAPGSLITEMLSNVGRNEPRKGPRDYKDSTCMMDLSEMREHIQNIRRADFDPMTPLMHKKCRYVLRGSIRTDGFRLQLLAFKLKELQSVRYRRLPQNVLPLLSTSTVGGVDYHLSEVRNIVKTPQDVANLWGCAPDQIKILGLDLGQACVLGASALLPERNDPKSVTKEPVTFYNLAVKQKAVYQPTFKHRRWMQEQKSIVPGDGMRSISDIETGLPPLRGEGACLAEYVEQFEAVKGQLDAFYNGNKRFKKHKWDARRARDAEYRLITDRLLNLVGGSIGRKRDEANKVVIGV
ncbi:hypothetical protein BGZ58_005260, partial [Dissophora ornata]